MASQNSRECHICGLPLAQNTPHRQNECPFCGRIFRRVDGVKRHTKICPSRGNRLLPPEARRGRKVHACDVCSRVKVSCDSKSPCTRCASRNLICTYERLCTNATHLAKLLSEENRVSRDSNPSKLPFLLACTDPSLGPVDEIILTRELEQNPDQPTASKPPDNQYTITDTIDPRLLFLGFIDPSFDMDLDSDDMDLQFLDNDLRARVSLLKSDLQPVGMGEPHVQDHRNSSSSMAFFTISNFRECMKMFFQKGKLLATIIHRPTFRPDQVDLTLLLAIVVTGSTYLHYQKGSAGCDPFALASRGIAEKYIFKRMEQLLGTALHSVDSQQTLELFQAAYIIETLQSCVKDTRTRQRIITKCHPMLVDFLRSRDVVGSRHSSQESERDWHKFVYKESCIRLVHWVFINDAWFSLFSSRPPAMTFLDMSGHLPCGHELWSAGCPTVYGSLQSKQDFSYSLPSLKTLVSGLLGDQWLESTEALYSRLDVQHFLVLVLAFQHVIFHYHTSLLVDNSSFILFRALDRWDRLWDDAIRRIDAEERKSLGLVRYSTELAFLFRRIVEAGTAKEGIQPKYLQRSVLYDTEALYQFIRQCKE